LLNICQVTSLLKTALPNKQNRRRMRKNDVTIVQFAPSNWVVEGIE
jgi:hypothetical protein